MKNIKKKKTLSTDLSLLKWDHKENNNTTQMQ